MKVAREGEYFVDTEGGWTCNEDSFRMRPAFCRTSSEPSISSKTFSIPFTHTDGFAEEFPNVVRDVHRGKLLTFPVDLGEERYGEDYRSGRGDGFAIWRGSRRIMAAMN